MVKKFLIVQLQNTKMVLPSGELRKFVIGEEIKAEYSEAEAISEINEIMNGEASEYLMGELPADFGYAIIPYYTKQ